MINFIGVQIERITAVSSKMSDEELCKEYNLLSIRRSIFVLKSL